MNCSFCGKPATRYATSAKNAREINVHCRRWTCRLQHWIVVWWRNVRIRRQA